MKLSHSARAKTQAFNLIPEPEIFVAKLFVIGPYSLHFLKTPHPAFAKTEPRPADVHKETRDKNSYDECRKKR